MLTKEELAARIHGREYGNEISDDEANEANKSRLVVVHGASDDLMELGGAINDEIDCYGGGMGIAVTPDGKTLSDHDECECQYCGYKAILETAKDIEAVWCDESIGGSWSYKTDIPHATFDIMEDGELYCRGIVFSLDDLK